MLDADKVIRLLAVEHARYGSDNVYDSDDIGWDELGGTFNTHDVLFEHVETSGGEGQGDHQHIVFKTTDVLNDVQYWKKEGYYNSYDGGEWDGDFGQVTPIERVVTFYE